MDTRDTVPGGKVEEPHRHGRDLAVHFGDMTVGARRVTEKRCAELCFGDCALISGVFEFGERLDHLGDRRSICRPGGSNGGGHCATPSAFRIVANFVVVSATSS